MWYTVGMAGWAGCLMAAFYWEVLRKKADDEPRFEGFGFWVALIGFIGCLFFNAASQG